MHSAFVVGWLRVGFSLLSFCLLVNSSSTARAQTYTWSASSDGKWSAGSNWSSGSAPSSGGGSGYTLNFNGSTSYTATNDLSGAFSLNQLNFNNTGKSDTATIASSGSGSSTTSISFAGTNPGVTIASTNLAGITISSGVSLGATTTFINNSASTLTVSGVISGSSGLTLGGSGTTSLTNNSNTYSGTTTINSGTVLLTAANSSANSPLGTGSVTMNGGILELVSNIPSSTATSTKSTVGNLTISGGSTVQIQAGSSIGATTLQFNSLSRSANGTLVYTPSVNSVLFFTNAPSLATSGGTSTGIVAPWTVVQTSSTNPDATFGTSSRSKLIAYNPTTTTLTDSTKVVLLSSNTSNSSSSAAAYALQVSGGVTLSNTGTVTLGSGSSGTQAGLILNGTSAISGGTLAFSSAEGVVYTSSKGSISSSITGSGGLTTFGPGTLTLSGSNTYSGGTNINSGLLQVNNTSGSGTGSDKVTVNSGGTLAGTGSISGAVTVNSGGTIRGGVAGSSSTATGTLTIANSVTFNAGSILQVDLNSTSSSNSTVSNLAVTGSSNTINLNSTSGPVQIQLVNDNNLVSSNSYSWVIATSAGGYNLNGKSASNFSYGTDFVVDTSSFADSSAGIFSLSISNVNSLVLSYRPVPEPSVIFSIAALVGCVGYGIRSYARRRQSIT